MIGYSMQIQGKLSSIAAFALVPLRKEESDRFSVGEKHNIVGISKRRASDTYLESYEAGLEACS